MSEIMKIVKYPEDLGIFSEGVGKITKAQNKHTKNNKADFIVCV